jgi:glutamine phosphoribosylpyrophosphate amidotransferase
MPISIDELKELIAARLSVEEMLDILGWDMYDLVEALHDEIEENKEEFLSAVE